MTDPIVADWTNPSPQHIEAVLRFGLRGLVTPTDLYVWRRLDLLHPEFMAVTGLHGLRLALRLNEVMVHDESVAFPEHFPWVFLNRVQAEQMDIEDRRAMVVAYLHANAHLTRVYPAGFFVVWYS